MLMNCHLIALRAKKWLENGRSARILHLFDDVCNLVDSRGDVLSLVTPSIGPGPLTLIVDAGFTAMQFTAVLNVGQPVHIEAETRQLTVGSLRFVTRQATVWQPRPVWSRLRRFNNWPALSAATPLTPGMMECLQQLLQGVQLDDGQKVRNGAAALAGRGPGLTPAGDDVLLGVLYGLWVWYPHRKWMAVIEETAVPRTTTLSAAFLRAAAAGEAVWQWHKLVSGHPDAVDNILAIGHSSGAATWAGFVSTGKIMVSPIVEYGEYKLAVSG